MSPAALVIGAMVALDVVLLVWELFKVLTREEE